jgi:hypothetical protein
MKSYSLSVQYLIVFLIAIVLSFSYGCSFTRKSKQKKENEFVQSQTVQIYSKPKTLISDYKRMKEHHIVSWLWIKPGFDLNNCGNVEVLPIVNYSNVKYKWAETKLNQELDKLYSPYNSGTGTMDLEISAAIIDLVPKKRLFKSNIIPKIAVELIIFDKSTKTVCCMISHYKKAEEFKGALDGLISDLKNLSDKPLRSEPQYPAQQD